MSTVNIRTAQNVMVEHSLATLGDRLLGGLIDGAIKFCYVIGIIIIIGSAFGDKIPEIQLGIIILLLLLPVFFYSLACEIFLNGQTLGKKAMQTRVVKQDGSPAGIGSYFIRWILRVIDNGIIGFLCIAISEYNQRLGDMAAGTVVIKIARKTYLSNTIPVLQNEHYEVQFPQAAQLSDMQISLIKETLQAYYKEDNYVAVDSLSHKLREILQIQTQMPPLAFLQTILKDHNHLHTKS